MALPRLLDSPRLRRLLGLALVTKGLLGVLAPRRTARAVTRLSLREVYDNPGDLEPRDTYVELIRNASLGILAFGGLTALRASGEAERDRDELSEADATEADAATDDEQETDR